MSFYAHNPFHRRQAPAYGYPYATGPTASPAPSFNFYAAPSANTRAASYYDDIDAEEQAALAHLHAIQQRREAAQLAARREAAIQAQIAAQREAAYAAVVERERAREEAIRHLLAEKQRRHEAAAAAQAIARERQRQAQAFAAQRQAQALAARHAFAQRAIEDEKRAEEFLKRRNAFAKRCAAGCAKKEEKKEQQQPDEWKQINDVLASLFGINLIDQEQPAQEEKKAEPAKEDKPATPAAAEPATPVNVERKTQSAEEKPATPAKSAAADKPAENQSEPASFDLNDLLSNFLGVSLEPAKDGDKSTEGADKLTAKLNDFLSQFGLEFEATPNVTVAETSSSAAKTSPVKVDTPARAPTPASAPVEGKGKGVAEGEKPAPRAQPAQSNQQHQQPQQAEPVEEPTSSAAALDKLRDISHELHLATESFTFPSKLAFADTTNSDATPALLFNKGNSGYHAQAHKLLQLLLAADGISSGGDREVKKQRKAIVKAIEGAIEQLEQKRDAIWAEIREKREQGAESSDDEGSVSSWNSTEPEHIEHANEEAEVQAQVEESKPDSATEQVEEEQKPEDKKEQTYAEATETTEESSNQVEVFDVPTTTTDKPVESEPQPRPSTENEQTQEKKASSKEDDFELL